QVGLLEGEVKAVDHDAGAGVGHVAGELYGHCDGVHEVGLKTIDRLDRDPDVASGGQFTGGAHALDGEVPFAPALFIRQWPPLADLGVKRAAKSRTADDRGEIQRPFDVIERRAANGGVRVVEIATGTEHATHRRLQAVI